MNSVGTILRTERESQGRETAEIAEELCITQRYLRAIEKDDLQSLPGSFFYKSFVKQYAAILGVDEKLLQPGIEALTTPVEPDPLPGAELYPAPISRTDHFSTGPTSPVRELDPIVKDNNRRYFSNPRMGLSVIGLAAVLLACSGFYAWWNKSPQTVVSVSRSSLATPVKSEAAPSMEVTTTTGPDGVNHVVLNLSATEKTWLSITSDGKPIFSGTLQPSQTKTLTGMDVAKLKVGNAGGLEVRWNGKPIGPIGPRGQVRVVLFTPENFQILPPKETL